MDQLKRDAEFIPFFHFCTTKSGWVTPRANRRRDHILNLPCSTARLKLSHHQTIFVPVCMSVKKRFEFNCCSNLHVLHTYDIKRILSFISYFLLKAMSLFFSDSSLWSGRGEKKEHPARDLLNWKHYICVIFQIWMLVASYNFFVTSLNLHPW